MVPRKADKMAAYEIPHCEIIMKLTSSVHIIMLFLWSTTSNLLEPSMRRIWIEYIGVIFVDITQSVSFDPFTRSLHNVCVCFKKA